MIIKKYQGKTEEEARDRAIKELGNGIYVMNVKQVKQKGLRRLFKSPYTEITVALEEETEPPAARQLTPKPEPPLIKGEAGKEVNKTDSSRKEADWDEDKALEEKLDSIHTLLKEQLKEQTKDKEKEKNKKEEAGADKEKDSGKEKSEEESAEDKNKKDVILSLIRETLLENEMDGKYVNSILEEAENSLKDDTPMDYILSHIYERMILRFGKAEIIGPAKEGPKVIFFVGTTGVGKTTTIAKIASKFVVCRQKGEKQKVALLTADTYRIAAAEQLRTYANILEVPFRVVYTTEEMGAALKDFWEYEYIFVDTAGHSQNNEEQRDGMGEFIQYVKQYAEIEVFLVLAANTKYKDLISIADKYKEMTEYKLIFTKLDETETYGNLLNLKMYTGASMSYVTYGQNVPEDFDIFNPQGTVKKLLGGK